MEALNKIQKGQVKLDVGGKLYSTSVSTLTSIPDSMLGAMFSGRYELIKNDEGRIFIDRDGKYFRYILEFLRDGEWDLPETDTVLLKKIIKDISYFGLEHTLPEKLQQKKLKKEKIDTSSWKMFLAENIQANGEHKHFLWLENVKDQFVIAVPSNCNGWICVKILGNSDERFWTWTGSPVFIPDKFIKKTKEIDDVSLFESHSWKITKSENENKFKNKKQQQQEEKI